MTFLATTLFTIDILKLFNIIINKTNNYKIYIIFSVSFILILIFLIVIRIIIDIKRYPPTDELLFINLKFKESMLKKYNLYIILCKLLHIFKAQLPLYYHTRMYMFIVKYEVMKWFIYKYSFKKFIKEIIYIKFNKIDIFLLSYYYRWLVFYDSSDMREELRLVKEREDAIRIFILKKLKKKYNIKETDKKGIDGEEIITEETRNIIKSKEYKDLVENNKEFIDLQIIKKIYNKQLKINSTLMINVQKNIYYLEFSYFYLRLNHIFFHYSLILFWLLTTTKIWFTDLKIKLVEPFVKAHSKYLIYQFTDNVTLRRKIDYQNQSTFEIMGHSKTIKNIDNWKITDPVTMYDGNIKYHYHFRVNGYNETDWYTNRDNQVWDHFSGKGTFEKNNRGLQTWHSYISRTHWGSDIDFSYSITPIKPKLEAYFKGYKYIGYPERFFDYIIDMGGYFLDCIIFKTGALIPEIYEVDCNTAMPLVINFNLLFLVILFQFWCVITVLLISRKVQIIVKENYFYFFGMFSLSIFYYFLTFLPYFDHNFIMDALLYILKLPFGYLKFNISDAQFIYILIV